MKQLNITRNKRKYSIRDLEFNYDSLNDLLYVYKKDSNVYTTVVIGEFHLEFNKKGELIGVEILKASEILEEYDISTKILENLDKVELNVVISNNSLLVFLMLHALNQEKSATITMNNLDSPIMQKIAAA